MTVESLVADVKAAVKEANISRLDEKRDIQVTELVLTLNILTQKSGGAEIEFEVPFIGMKFGTGATVTRKNTQTFELTLVPPGRRGAEIRGGDVQESLVQSIRTIRSVIASAGGGDDPFLLKESIVTLEFALTESGKVKLIGAGELSDEVTHSLKLTLGPSDDSDR